MPDFEDNSSRLATGSPGIPRLSTRTGFGSHQGRHHGVSWAFIGGGSATLPKTYSRRQRRPWRRYCGDFFCCCLRFSILFAAARSSSPRSKRELPSSSLVIGIPCSMSTSNSETLLLALPPPLSPPSTTRLTSRPLVPSATSWPTRVWAARRLHCA